MRIVCNKKRRFYYNNSRRSNTGNIELMGTISHVKKGTHNKTKDSMMRLLTAASDGNAVFLNAIQLDYSVQLQQSKFWKFRAS